MQDFAAQVASARNAVAIADRSARGRFIARGADRLAFLHNMLSAPITTLAPGQGCRAELLDDRGHVVGDLRVLAGTDYVLLDTEPGRAEAVRTALDKFIIMDDVQLEDASTTLALFTVVGPKAPEVLRAILAGEPPAPLWAHATFVLAGVEARVAHTRWTGANDFDVFVPAAQASAVREMLEKGVLAAGGAVLSPEAFEVLRVEAGVARQGADLDDVVALEARLDKEGAVSFTKGCYLGQEVMARIDARGHVNRLLVGLLVDGDAPPAAGASVRADGKEVGRITSAVFSPTLGRPIALGYVRREVSEPGHSLTVGDAKATVAALPFVA
ncbi:MAG TPA: glycine cleavage T C-terminal barrel domain-containing protein [bacterium]|nr:glycine cleavage T C-terminal barrel domain-containing protein [bacterium]